jgi:hypothetical protein
MKTILLILITTLLLQGCVNRRVVQETFDSMQVNLQNMARQIKIEGEDIHKANRIKYVKGGKKEILQAAMAALLELGFHINNQDYSLGVLSATANRDSTFLDEAVYAAERRHRQKIVNVLKDGDREGFSGPGGTAPGVMVAAILSQKKEELNTISINVIVMERKLDNQVSLRITYTVSPYVGPESEQILFGISAGEWLTSAIETGLLQGDEYPKYTLPPSTLTLIYKRFWDTTEKQLFQHNIILNR